MRVTILVQDKVVAGLVRNRLRKDGYDIRVISNAGEAQSILEFDEPDLAILDLHLAGTNALELVRQIRSAQRGLPILVMSSHRGDDAEIKALDAGADDYLYRPFHGRLLSARVRALLRRNSREARPAVTVGDLRLDYMRRAAVRDGRQIALSTREFALLEYLMQNAGRCVTRPDILGHVWSEDPDRTSNIVDVYIYYLRNKVDKGFHKKLLRTIRNVGYTLSERSVKRQAARPELWHGRERFKRPGVSRR